MKLRAACRATTFAVLMLFCLSLQSAAAHSAPAQLRSIALSDLSRLIVGPNIHVDSDPNTAFVEPSVAADPTNPKNLVGASMLFTLDTLNTRLFHSRDGGDTWMQAIAPAEMHFAGDVQLAFDADANPYFAVLGDNLSITVPPHSSKNGLYVFRSTTGGKSWSERAFLQYRMANGELHSYDHEQLAIDTAPHSRFRGNIYLTVLYSTRLKPQQNEIGLLSSSNGGRTFRGPVAIQGKGWPFNSPPIVFSNGEILLPWIDTTTGRAKPVPFESIEVSRSSDGGATVTRPRKIFTRWLWADQMARIQRGETAYDGDSVPQYAVDRSDAHKDRAYVVWSDMRYPQSRVLFSYSSDRGLTWSTPVIVAADAPVRGSQYQAEVAVNAKGVVGISWFDTRDGSPHEYNEYFTASLDGGKTFLRPVRVSSESSQPHGEGNDAYYIGGSDQYEKQLWAFMVSPVGRYPSGGDYMGLTADAWDAFHPFWIDGRSGTDQVYSAAVRVVSGGMTADRPSSLAESDITANVDLSFDAGTWIGSRHTLSLPVRLRNTSDVNIYPPFVVTVKSTQIHGGWGSTRILNADNSNQGRGAIFRYKLNPHGLGYLPPGGVTDARIWKLRLTMFGTEPALGTSITGFVRK